MFFNIICVHEMFFNFAKNLAKKNVSFYMSQIYSQRLIYINMYIIYAMEGGGGGGQ